jgi:GT2 family glycosyltransferase
MNARTFTSQLSLICSRVQKAWGFVKTYGISSLRSRYIDSYEYQSWIAACDTIADPDRQRILGELSEFSYQPLISVVVPVYNVDERYLREAIESVRGQIYQNWELCIVDDRSSISALHSVIESYAQLDSRIRYRFLSTNVGISDATNAAVELAKGDFIGFLDHDDLLREHTLSSVVAELNRHPGAELLFTDEDRLSQAGLRCKPYFKGGWNPELMLSHNAVCHFMVVRSATFRELGGMRSVCNGAQDWDLALRVAERVGREKIHHIPQVLYHWRESPSSTALNLDSKPYVRTAQQRVLSEHLERRGEPGVTLEALPYTSMWRPRFGAALSFASISLIIPHALLRCSPLTTRWVRTLVQENPNLEVLVVDPGSETLQLEEFVEEYNSVVSSAVSPIKALELDYARIFNRGAVSARGSILCFVGGEIVQAAPRWLKALVAQVSRGDIGAAGPVLVSAQGNTQSAGLLLGGNEVLGLFRRLPAHSLGNMYRLALARDVSALSAQCLMMRKAVLDQVRGFEEKHVLGDLCSVDLSIKLRAHGYRLIVTPLSRVEIRDQSLSQDLRAFETLRGRWPESFRADSLWNPNLTASGGLRSTLGKRSLAD